MPAVPLRVVVAGAGPGGIAAAIALHEAGAVVTVLERAGETIAAGRRSSIFLREAGSTWQWLESIGLHALLAGTTTTLDPAIHVVSLRALDEALREVARTRGIDLRTATAVEQVIEGAAETAAPITVVARDTLTGVRNIVADWFIDATGGRSPLRTDPRFARELARGRARLFEPELRLVTMQVPAMPGRQATWAATDPGKGFVINDVVEGVATIYVPLLGRRAGHTPAPRTQANLIQAARAELGIPSGLRRLGAPHLVTTRQTIAPMAADGHILLVGDAVGTMLPMKQAGVDQAVRDAHMAVDAILAAVKSGSDAPITAYDHDALTLHRMLLY